ncbi:MAG: glycosyltransferase family 39 protein [Acidimicrobiales bacterium]
MITRWWVRPLAIRALWRLLSFCIFVAVGGKPIVGAARWDDGYYLTILRQGYRPFPAYGAFQQTEFFPLLPWTTRVVQALVRSETVAVHIVVSAASLAAVLLIYTIARRYRDEATALLAVAVLLGSPGSIFLWLFFSEGIYIALSAGALLAAESRRPLLAAALGAGVAMCRPLGVLIVVPLLLAQAERRPRAERRRVDCTTATAFVPVVGLLVVMAAQWRQAGDPFAYPKVSALWGRHNSLPITPLVERLQEMFVLRLFNGVILADWLCMVVVLAMGAYSLRARFSCALPAAILIADKLRGRQRLTLVVLILSLTFLEVQIASAWHGGLYVG